MEYPASLLSNNIRQVRTRIILLLITCRFRKSFTGFRRSGISKHLSLAESSEHSRARPEVVDTEQKGCVKVSTWRVVSVTRTSLLVYMSRQARV